MRFKGEEVGFHVCHLPESFYGIILVLFHLMIKKCYGMEQVFTINKGRNSGEMLNLINSIGS